MRKTLLTIVMLLTVLIIGYSQIERELTPGEIMQIEKRLNALDKLLELTQVQKDSIYVCHEYFIKEKAIQKDSIGDDIEKYSVILKDLHTKLSLRIDSVLTEEQRVLLSTGNKK